MTAPVVLDAPGLQSQLADGLPESDSLYELYYGQRVEKAMSTLAAVPASRLLGKLVICAEQSGVGEAVAEALFDLDPAARLQRRPDVAFVRAKPGQDLEIDESAAWTIPPDLAVEVVSPSNLAEDLEEKLDEYFAAGVRRVWIIYPRSRKLNDYTTATHCARIPESGTVDGGEILPGFQLHVGDLFRGLKPLPELVHTDE